MENGLTIPTITLLNPELGLSQFLRSGAKPLRELSPVVTIFGDLKVCSQCPPCPHTFLPPPPPPPQHRIAICCYACLGVGCALVFPN